MSNTDRQKLEDAGAWYNPSSQFNKSLAKNFRVNNKGWYYGRQFIGFNIKEALKWLRNRHLIR